MRLRGTSKVGMLLLVRSLSMEPRGIAFTSVGVATLAAWLYESTVTLSVVEVCADLTVTLLIETSPWLPTVMVQRTEPSTDVADEPKRAH